MPAVVVDAVVVDAVATVAAFSVSVLVEESRGVWINEADSLRIHLRGPQYLMMMMTKLWAVGAKRFGSVRPVCARGTCLREGASLKLYGGLSFPNSLWS